MDKLTFIWGAGCTDTGEDHIYIYKIADQSAEFVSSDISGPFYGVDTGDVDGDGHDES